MSLYVQVLRFTCTSCLSMTMPVPASNKLRGAMGSLLHERPDASYEHFFRPVLDSGPSGLSDPPRPFVLRAAHLDGIALPNGSDFYFDLHLFDLRTPWVSILSESLRHTGFCQLRNVAASAPLALNLAPEAGAVHRVKVRFETPMELKSHGVLAAKPEFAVLAARIRDRLSTLSQLYGEGPLPLDFAAFGQRAAAVQMVRCDVRREEAQRRSGSTGQTHSLGGFVGEAEYEGDLTEFMPYLRAAQWTGAGRQTTWGKGVVAIQE